MSELDKDLHICISVSIVCPVQIWQYFHIAHVNPCVAALEHQPYIRIRAILEA
jgi:hypothetical protein